VSFDHPVQNIPIRIIADPPADPVWDAVLQLARSQGG
jgi:hypothetical protein